ncbi:hypothetical protein AKJ09_00449 [Labilithrix luteola]|uniref:VOC domain-containing protein n=1 Tax=Labilithrix luteola TaxID=1391654 RepID=A0A0K1PJU0_9BACT|nr:hypothetical protein [Labilithrix luteola]AKU93785.1 hypothetical protein AKJ09_00449 [Labilithrix luteola]
MEITNVIYPVVVEDFADYANTVAHYREVLGLPLKAEFSHQGFTVSWLGPMVVVSARDKAALDVALEVEGILVVDDLDAFWQRMQGRTEVLVAPEEVPSGRRFVVRHQDGRAVEYLDLANSR